MTRRRLLSLSVFVAAVLVMCALVVEADSCALGPVPADEAVISGDLHDKPTTCGPAMRKADIGIGGYHLFTIRTPAAGFTIAERERVVYMRLTRVISINLPLPYRWRVAKIRGKPTVYAGEYRLITVYPRDARAAGCTSMALAKQWCASLLDELPHVCPCMATLTCIEN